jgi:hypothetical protein
MFVPHPNLSDTINRCVIQCEIEGGVHLRDVAPGTVLEVETENHVYTVVPQVTGHAIISGHPVFCPDPVLVKICGSTWGGSMLKEHYIGRGMHMEFRHPEFLPITTSRVVEIRAVPTGDRMTRVAA